MNRTQFLETLLSSQLTINVKESDFFFAEQISERILQTESLGTREYIVEATNEMLKNIKSEVDNAKIENDLLLLFDFILMDQAFDGKRLFQRLSLATQLRNTPREATYYKAIKEVSEYLALDLIGIKTNEGKEDRLRRKELGRLLGNKTSSLRRQAKAQAERIEIMHWIESDIKMHGERHLASRVMTQFKISDRKARGIIAQAKIENKI